MGEGRSSDSLLYPLGRSRELRATENIQHGSLPFSREGKGTSQAETKTNNVTTVSRYEVSKKTGITFFQVSDQLPWYKKTRRLLGSDEKLITLLGNHLFLEVEAFPTKHMWSRRRVHHAHSALWSEKWQPMIQPLAKWAPWEVTAGHAFCRSVPWRAFPLSVRCVYVSDTPS